MFGVRRRGWCPPDHGTLRDVLESSVQGLSVTVRKHAGRHPKSLFALLRQKLNCSPAVMLTATCKLLKENVSAHHAFVATMATLDGIGVVDSLASVPRRDAKCNAWIPCAQTASNGLLHVANARWAIDLSAPLYTVDFAFTSFHE